MNTKVAILGAQGQLGVELCQEVLKRNLELIPVTRQDLDITKDDLVKKFIEKNNPDIVINAAAYVNVELCDENIEEAFRVNALGAYYVARAAALFKKPYVYISTDYVFNGEKSFSQSFSEEDRTSPVNTYGISKLTGESLVCLAHPTSLIIRLSSLFGVRGASGKSGNFISKILEKARKNEIISLVDDQVMRPTYAPDAAWTILELIEKKQTGLFHVANSGFCTWYEFGKKALDYCRYSGVINKISAQDCFSKVVRPKNSILSTDKLEKHLGIKIRAWQDALEVYLEEKKDLYFFHQ